MGRKDDIDGPESVYGLFFPRLQIDNISKADAEKKVVEYIRARAFHDHQVIEYPKNTHLMRTSQSRRRAL